jgi:membrane-associated phospholipid phosphatase
MRRRLFLVFCALAASAAAHAESGTQRAGDFLQFAPPAAGFAATVYLRDGTGAEQFFESLAVELGAVYSMKYAVDKHRPRGTGGRAFPSGHTAAAFQGASFIDRRYGWRWGVPAYLVGGFVGWSRIESHQHDFPDVLFGGAIGVVCSYVFTSPYQGKHARVAPVSVAGIRGICVEVSW